MPLDLLALRRALAVAAHGSFARAAEALHLTQPALSRSVAQLEHDLGARLFDRTATGVELTVFGKLLTERGGVLIGQALELDRDIHAIKGLAAGRLHVVAGPVASRLSVGAAIARLLRTHPGLTVRVEAGDWRNVVDRVAGRQVEVGVAETALAETRSDLEVEPLPPHRGILVCRPGHPLLAAGQPVTAQQALQFPLAMQALGPRLMTVFAPFPACLTQDPATGEFLPRICVDTFELGVAAVLESDAVGATLPALVESDLATGRLVALPVLLPGLETAYGFVRLRARTPSPAAMTFMAEVRRVEAEIHERESAALERFEAPKRVRTARRRGAAARR